MLVKTKLKYCNPGDKVEYLVEGRYWSKCIIKEIISRRSKNGERFSVIFEHEVNQTEKDESCYTFFKKLEPSVHYVIDYIGSPIKSMKEFDNLSVGQHLLLVNDAGKAVALGIIEEHAYNHIRLYDKWGLGYDQEDQVYFPNLLENDYQIFVYG